MGNLQLVSTFLLWCTLLNYGVLLMRFLVFVMARRWLLELHGKWLSRPQFDAIHYAGMAVYKIAILLFNLVPYGALLLVKGHAG